MFFEGGKQHLTRTYLAIFKIPLGLSLSKSNSSSVGVLSPEETSANFLPELGTDLRNDSVGTIRQLIDSP